MYESMEAFAPATNQQLLDRFGAAKEMIKKMDNAGDGMIPSLRESSNRNAPQLNDDDEKELPDMNQLREMMGYGNREYETDIPNSVSEAFSCDGMQMPYNARALMDETVRMGNGRQNASVKPQGQQATSGVVDYSLIKDIVELAIKRALDDRDGGDGTTIKRVKLGEKIQVVDDEGNLYEGDLVFKKNIKKK